MKLIKNNLIYIAILSFLILGITFLTQSSYFSNINSEEIKKLENKAAVFGYSDNNRDINKALSIYREILSKDPENKEALYNIAHLQVSNNSLESALKSANKFENKYPEEKRIQYIKGLINSYLKNHKNAKDNFKEFIKAYPDEWAGYLDLAWVYFKDSDFKNSKIYLEKGLDRKVDNPWLNLSYGVVLYNLDQKQDAIKYLKKANIESKKITPDIWRQAYLINDPSKIKDEIKQFKDIIQYNIALVSGDKKQENDLYLKVNNSPFADFASTTDNSGLVVSACNSAPTRLRCPRSCNSCGCVAGGNLVTNINACARPQALPRNFDQTCYSSANSCGDKGIGKIQCNGLCSAQKPSDKNCYPIKPKKGVENVGGPETIIDRKRSCSKKPKNYQKKCFTEANICNLKNEGKIRCDGSCSAQKPSDTVCNQPIDPVCGQPDVFRISNQEVASLTCRNNSVSNISNCGRVSNVAGTKDCINIELECSVDKQRWFDCSSKVIQLIDINSPFYVRHITDETLCSQDVVYKNLTNNTIKPRISNSKETREIEKYNVNSSDFKKLPDTQKRKIFTHDISGSCLYSTDIEKLKIKILNISIQEI